MTAKQHPGAFLRQELEKRGWTQNDLTFILGTNPKAVNQIINGKQGISPVMSKALGEALGVSPDFFADIQKEYDLDQANDPNPSVSLRAKLQSNYPIREMIKRGWLKDGDVESLSKQLADFFEVATADDVPFMAHAAKKTNYEEKEISPAQLTWLFRVKQLAKSIWAPPYSEKELRKNLNKLRSLLSEPEEIRHVPRILAECGVRLIVVETLPQAKIDGVCLWLDAQSPVIGLSARFDRIDNFWFVLRHEIEHVLLGHGKEDVPHIDVLDGASSETAKQIPQEEVLANAAASDFCVPKAKIDSFMARKEPFYYEKDVLAFSKVQNIHPGLVVGQIQYRLGRYDYLKKYQVKIRQYLLPGAIVDGWGQTSAA